MQKLAIVIPCYNEAVRLDRKELLAQIAQQPYLNLILVNDGSTDDTERVIVDLANQHPARIQMISLAKNCGKGEAVRVGALQALDQGYPLIGYWDADLATPLTEIPDFLSVLEQHQQVQVVLGSRVKLLGRSIQRRKIRHYVGRVFATAASIVLALPVYDTQCGAKIFRVFNVSDDLAEKPDRRASTFDIRCLFAVPFRSRWLFDIEILARFLKYFSNQTVHPKARLYEVPLKTWRDVKGSKVKSKDFFVAMYELVVIWCRYRRAD